MPLDKTCSVDAMSKNISQSIKDGKPQKQAVAISFSVLKKACGVEGGGMTPKEIVAGAKKQEGTMVDIQFGEEKQSPEHKALADALRKSVDRSFDNVKIAPYKDEETLVLMFTVPKAVWGAIANDVKDALHGKEFRGKDSYEDEFASRYDKEMADHVEGKIREALEMAKIKSLSWDVGTEEKMVYGGGLGGERIKWKLQVSDFMSSQAEGRVAVAFGSEIDEAGESTQMVCNECGARFKKKITAKTFEVKCPKCGGYDTEPEI